MKFTLEDLSLLRLSLPAFGAALLFSIAFVYGTGQHAGQVERERVLAQSRLEAARGELTAANDDLKNMAVYADEYAKLDTGGVIGDGHRLDWIEELESLQRRNLVLGLRYTISPQTDYSPAQAINGGAFDIHYSAMELELDLLHEGQLLDFFDALRNDATGRFQLEGCTLRRTSETEPSPSAARLKAECRGGWITLKNRNAAP